MNPCASTAFVLTLKLMLVKWGICSSQVSEINEINSDLERIHSSCICIQLQHLEKNIGQFIALQVKYQVLVFRFAQRQGIEMEMLASCSKSESLSYNLLLLLQILGWKTSCCNTRATTRTSVRLGCIQTAGGISLPQPDTVVSWGGGGGRCISFYLYQVRPPPSGLWQVALD